MAKPLKYNRYNKIHFVLYLFYDKEKEKQESKRLRCSLRNIFRFLSGEIMDRRQKKTRDAIFAAFRRLLAKKRFEHITVGEIIDEANVGRSTFYAHFETKDALLREMCTDIFQHIFSRTPSSEATHDFSGERPTLEVLLTHILYHLKDSERDITALFASESGELFITYFKGYLSDLFASHREDFSSEAPADFLQNHLTGSFVEAVRWWIRGGLKEEPERVVAYYLSVTKGK